MKAIKLIIIQLASLLILAASAEEFMEQILPTTLFVVSFALFAVCSIYINKHEKNLLKEINLLFKEQV